MYPPPPGTPVEALDTPALLIDLPAFERNLDRMAAFSRRTGVGVRPHAKSHKTPLIARKQLDRGAVGITCSKLGEAEALVAGGIGGILISSQIVGRPKIARLLSLARHGDVMVVVDDPSNARALSDAAAAAGLRLGVLVEIDVGQHRCGTEPGAPAVELARLVGSLPGLRFEGLQGYEGHLQHVRSADERRARSDAAVARLLETRRAVEAAGQPVRIVSTAGTGTCAFAAAHPGVTEVQPGSYIFMDNDYGAVEGLEFESALTVLTTVVSRQRADAAVVDAGWKSITVENGRPTPKARPGLAYAPAGDEHGKLTAADPAALPALGEGVELLPSHCDTTVNLYDRFVAVRDGRVEAVWGIAGRGRVQ